MAARNAELIPRLSEIEFSNDFQSVRRHSPVDNRALGFSLRPSDSVGFTIGGRYRVEGLLGEGGTARVYLARDHRSEGLPLVVVKQLKAELLTNQALRDQFLLEARVLLSLNHQNIVKILSVERPRGESPFLTLEALKGETLGDYLKREGQLELGLALRFARQAALALDAAHEAGVVHRDIKPDNLFLVGPIGAPEHLVVIDFGMAETAEVPRDEGAKTRILGTAQYMAPEQILVEQMDSRTDIYGLGIVLFRAVSGELPFDTQSQGDLLRHQLFSPVPPASWLVQDLPWQVEKLTFNCTRKDPNARLSSMSSFVTAINHALGEANESRPAARLAAEMADWARDWPADERDVYQATSEQGQRALGILSQQFGAYAKPHTPSLPVPVPE